jgi:hypothetical protein
MLGLFKKKMTKSDFITSYGRAAEKKTKLEADLKRIRLEALTSEKDLDDDATRKIENEISMLSEAMAAAKERLINCIIDEKKADFAACEEKTNEIRAKVQSALSDAGKDFSLCRQRLRATGDSAMGQLASALESLPAEILKKQPEKLDSFTKGMTTAEILDLPNLRAELKAQHRIMERSKAVEKDPGALTRSAKVQAEALLGQAIKPDSKMASFLNLGRYQKNESN